MAFPRTFWGDVMTAHTQLPPTDPWAPGVRAADVPIFRPAAEPLFQEAANSLVPNRNDIVSHLYALFDPVFVMPYPDAWIEIAFGRPDGDLNAGRVVPSAAMLARPPTK